MIKSSIAMFAAGLALAGASIWFIQHLKSQAYDAGYNTAKLECVEERQEANNEQITLVAKQRDAYRIGLDIRNTQYAEIKSQLEERLNQAQEGNGHEICNDIRINYPD